MKKGCILTLLLLAGLVAGYYYLISKYYPYPDNLIGAGIVGFMNYLAIGMFMNARNSLRDLGCLRRHLAGKMPQDGQLIAAIGTIHPIGAPLIAPLSGKECVLYDYKIFHEHRNSDNSKSQISSYMGYGLALSEIRTGIGSVKLLGYPTLEGFGKSWIPSNEGASHARKYIAETKFEDMSGMKLAKTFSKLKEYLSDDDGIIREDWKMSKGDVDVELENFEEERVEVGEQVCAFGIYSATRGGIIANLSSGVLNRLHKGVERGISKRLKSSALMMIIFGSVFMLFSNGALALAILNAPKQVQSPAVP